MCPAVMRALFALQVGGTGRVGRIFGPVMVLWFATIGALGVAEIAHHPAVLLALSPYYGIWMCLHYKLLAFVALGAVVLAVTGAEALYADMGHFGAQPIRLVWLFYLLPCLGLNYFRHGPLMMRDP